MGMAATVIAANLPRAAARELRHHRGSATACPISDFEAAATAAALPREKARPDRRDERRPATTRLNAPLTGILCGLLDSVVGDMTPAYRPRGAIQPRNRDLAASTSTSHRGVRRWSPFPSRCPNAYYPGRAQHPGYTDWRTGPCDCGT